MNKNLEQFQIHINAQEHLGSSNDDFYGFRKTQFYINNSSVNFFVIHRNNLSVKTHRQFDQNFPKGDIIVRTVYEFTNTNTVKEVDKAIEDVLRCHNLRAPDLRIIQERLRKAMGRSPFTTKEYVILDRVIPAKLIVEKKMVYLHDEDLLITTKEMSDRLHPFSSEAGLDPESVDYVTNHGLTGLFIELIDNEHQSSTRYMFSGRRLLEVNPKKDPNRPSGVYYYHNTHHPLSGSDIKEGFCTLEEAQGEVGLFKTRDEAMSGGDPEIISKKEFEDSKKEVLKLQQELERSKQEAQIERERSEHLKLEREEYYAERKQQRNDGYEQRSTSRKDSSDILKLSAAAVGGALAVFGVWKASR